MELCLTVLFRNEESVPSRETLILRSLRGKTLNVVANARKTYWCARMHARTRARTCACALFERFTTVQCPMG